MKYVIFKRSRLFCPVIIPEHITHSQIKIEGCSVHSAGFFYMGGQTPEDIITLLPESSDSLGVGPKPGDKELLVSTLAGFGMYAFME